MAIQWRNTLSRYGAVAMTLHWLMALAIVFMIALGLYMTSLPEGSTQQFQAFQLHKSIGITILILTLLRIGWRLANPVPPIPADLPAWERLAGRISHFALYFFMLVIPLFGWATVSFSELDIPTMLYGAVEWPHLPIRDMVADPASAEEFAAEVHEYLAFTLAGLLVIHVGAALRHHLVLKDTVLERMMPDVSGTPAKTDNDD